MPHTDEQVELEEIMKGFPKSFVQNRDLTKGGRMGSHSSWTDTCCSFPECSNDLNFELCPGKFMNLNWSQGSVPGFFNLVTINIRVRSFCRGGMYQTMHGRVCVCIPGFHLPDANGSHTPKITQPKSVCYHCHGPFGTQSHSPENH